MKFIPTYLTGSFLVEPEKHADERGFFARVWCQREFSAQGIASNLVQCSISYNKYAGILRGMHYQLPPYSEDKLIRVTRGRIYDVIVDLHPDSINFLRWLAVELTEENRLALYIPKGFAHGFLSLEDNTEVFYQMSEFYMPEYERGFRWDDSSVGITWPGSIKIMAEHDRSYASLQPDDLVAFKAKSD